MASGTLQLRGTVSGLPIGTLNVEPARVETAAPIGTRTLTNLASGDNTINIPTGTTSVILLPPAGNSVALTLKGAGGDTGRRLHNTRWVALHFDSSVTSFILNAGGSPVNNFEIVFI